MNRVFGLALCGAAVLLCPASVRAEDPFAVSLKETSGGAYEIKAVLKTGVSVQAAWKVLTDYGRIHEFISSVRSSRVIERDSSRVLLAQETSYEVFFYKRDFKVVLDVRETPPARIDFEDTLKRDFRVYKGSWVLEPGEGGARAKYHVLADPDSRTPAFIAKWFIMNDVKRFLNDLLLEMNKQGA